MRWSGLFVPPTLRTSLSTCTKYICYLRDACFCLMYMWSATVLYSVLRLSGWSPSFCVRSPHSGERNLLTLKPPCLLGPLACRVFRRCGMSDGEEEDSMKCSFRSETEALAVKRFLLFLFLSYFGSFQLLSSTPVISSFLHPVLLLGRSSVAPDVTNTITPVPHPSKPSTPPSVSITTFVLTEP